MKDAIFQLRAEGLGHAILIPQHHELLSTAINTKVRIESNPISNMVLNLINNVKDLKLDVLLKKNMLMMNCDDCSMWKNGSLSENI